MDQAAAPPLAVEQHTLGNGLRVVLAQDPALPLVAVNIWYHVGSRNERPGRTGFAHLFEHMLFQGSQHVGTNDHFRYVQQAGGVANGSTWYDRTNYYETLPAHQLELGLWLESDRMGYLLPAMTAEKLETQRQVVMNERRQRVENQPYGRAFERVHELLYPAQHPYHWPVIGYMEDIAAATLEDVQTFFRTWYTPNNAVLTLAGAIDPPAALGLVDHYFGDIPAGPAPQPAPPPPLPVGGGRREELADDVQLARLYLAFHGPAYGADDWYAGDLLATVLTGGRSSPMYRDLVHGRQLAQDVALFVLPTELSATVALVATARPEVSPATLEAALWEHLQRAAAGPPAAEGLERAHNRLLTSHYQSLQEVDQRADQLSQHALYFGDPAGMAREVERYLAVDGAALATFAAGHLRPQQAVTVTVVPR
ncbi:MAG TPA: pitrilysin family protein [Thermoanaerobaculia bacterium]|nr:pitrilysin family protein [Thermoanaerobaculia bacterium]